MRYMGTSLQKNTSMYCSGTCLLFTSQANFQTLHWHDEEVVEEEEEEEKEERKNERIFSRG